MTKLLSMPVNGVAPGGRRFRTIFSFVSALLLCTASGIAFAGPGGGGPGGGGGGGAATLTITGAGTALVAQTGSSTPGFPVIATFKNAAPEITLTAAPAGLFIENMISTRSKGGPWTTIASVGAWTPTRDQIGVHSITFTATADGLSQSATMTITVQDAPDPVTGLSVTSQGGLIHASWQPSATGGAAPISYIVEGCYSTGPRAFGNICEQTGTTTATQVSFPSNHVGDFPGPYILVIVTPMDADGIEGGRIVMAPTIAAP